MRYIWLRRKHFVLQLIDMMVCRARCTTRTRRSKLTLVTSGARSQDALSDLFLMAEKRDYIHTALKRKFFDQFLKLYCLWAKHWFGSYFCVSHSCQNALVSCAGLELPNSRFRMWMCLQIRHIRGALQSQAFLTGHQIHCIWHQKWLRLRVLVFLQRCAEIS